MFQPKRPQTIRSNWKWVVIIASAILLISPMQPQQVSASPSSPGEVPDEVGNWDEARHHCDLQGSLPWFGAPWIEADCNYTLNKLDSLFSDAYREAEHEGASPGYTTNQLHFWNTVLIQDFWYGNWGDGALIWGQTQDARPHYVGGGAWNAYKRAANNYSVWPGYPINTEHDWNRVRIQDFRGGGWGDGAIIGGANAELVAGNHWRAYISADGSNRLRNPVTFVNYQSGEFYADPFGGGYRVSGWFWVQQFEGGQIWERNGTAYVWFYDTGTWHQVL